MTDRLTSGGVNRGGSGGALLYQILRYTIFFSHIPFHPFIPFQTPSPSVWNENCLSRYNNGRGIEKIIGTLCTPLRPTNSPTRVFIGSYTSHDSIFLSQQRRAGQRPVLLPVQEQPALLHRHRVPHPRHRPNRLSKLQVPGYKVRVCLLCVPKFWSIQHLSIICTFFSLCSSIPASVCLSLSI